MIDINKHYTTHSGHPVRIYATDGKEPATVHGAYLMEGEWQHSTWSEDGAFFLHTRIESGLDLVEATDDYKYGTTPEAIKTQFNEEC